MQAEDQGRRKRESIMKSGIILDANDVKKIIAEKYGVDESRVIKSQYSWIVATDEIVGDKNDTSSSLE